MIIRKATIKDIEELEKINKIAHHELKWWIALDKKFYKKFLRNGNNDLFVAEIDNKIIGFLSLELNKARKSTWINDVYVVKERRKTGAAKKLVSAALKSWKKRSKSIVLLTADRNLKIFEKLGFKKTMNFMEQKT